MSFISFCNQMGELTFGPDKCPKNVSEHKFLFWRWKSKGPHDYEIKNLKPWGASVWKMYEFDVYCKICGNKLGRPFGVDESDLIKAGVKL